MPLQGLPALLSIKSRPLASPPGPIAEGLGGGGASQLPEESYGEVLYRSRGLKSETLCQRFSTGVTLAQGHLIISEDIFGSHN